MNRFIEPEINVPRARSHNLAQKTRRGRLTRQRSLSWERQNRYKVVQSRFEFGLRTHQCYLDSKS